ncbi:MAG: YwaF family protein [Clostridia bacterium]|nr:YwaF family protein [Clostridia bacterium]
MREFFGFGGYERPVEGAMSWQHLTFVCTLMALMVGLSVLLGLWNRQKEFKYKNRVLIVTAILIDSIELFKIILFCFRSGDPWDWLHNLPLFLCSIQLIAIPLAAFSKGRIRDAALDFVFIFGLLGAIFGTFGATQNYNAYPVLAFDNVVSGITHSMSGFASLYIAISGMASMKKKNVGITFGILSGFCVIAYIANLLVDYNYMFLMSHDGTPYSIVYNLVGGNAILYPIAVVLLFLVYIACFYYVFFLVQKWRAAKRQRITAIVQG